jgi:hypothetical protein
MKNIISKADLSKKIRGKESKEEEVEAIIGTYEMPPCKHLSYVTPGTVIYDSKVNGYFKFINYVSPLKLSNGKSHWILKAFLLYTEDNITKRQYRDCLKSYYTDNTITIAPVINYKEVRLVDDEEYLELVTGVRDLEIEKSKNPTTPMNLLFNSLLETSTFKVDDKTYYITRLDETEVKCIEITSDYKVIHHTFNLNNLIQHF